MHHLWGLASAFIKMTVMFFTECLCQKIKFSSHIVAVVIGTRVCSVARLPLTIVTSRFEQWEVVDTNVIVKWQASIRLLWRHSVASSVCRAKLTPQTTPRKRHLRQLIGTKHKPCVTYGLKASISNPTGQFLLLIWYHPCDWSYLSTEGVTLELNVENLRVSCYDGNNDRTLFVKHPRAQGGWLRHHSPWALGCFQNNTRAAPVIIPKILYGCLTHCG